MLWILTCLSSCEYAVVQAQLAILLGLDSTSTRIPINSIAAFAANADPEIAYDQFCNDLCQIGITEDIIWQKKDGILEILRSQGMVAKSPIGGSGTSDKDQVLEAAYHEYCNDLYRMGFTEDLMPPKARVLKILRSRGIVSSSQSGGIIGKKGQLDCSLFTYLQVLIYSQMVTLVVQRLFLHLGRALSFG